MRLLKSSTLLGLYNSYVVDSPQPVNLSYMWNFGSLLAICLGTQIVTGVLLAMHYTPNVDLAFVSVEHALMCSVCPHYQQLQWFTGKRPHVRLRDCLASALAARVTVRQSRE